MQHTLIPFQDRHKIHIEYYVRVFTVLVNVLSLAIILGIAAMSPAYINAWLNNRAAESAVASLRVSKADTDTDKVSAELATDNDLVAFLASNMNDQKLSQVIKSVIAAQGESMITAFNLGRAENQVIQIAITGTSPTRENLLILKRKLETEVSGAKVNLPIDQLAREVNVPFSLQFVQTTQVPVSSSESSNQK